MLLKCIAIFSALLYREHSTEPKGSPNYVINRVVGLYSHCTHFSVKNKILKQFTSPSVLRLVVATSAFGMGVDCPDVRQVFHWGVPKDAETLTLFFGAFVTFLRLIKFLS